MSDLQDITDGCGCAHSILHEPLRHKLVELFRELRYGRPSVEQQFLTELAALVERNGVQRRGLNETLEELDDPADWWKRES